MCRQSEAFPSFFTPRTDRPLVIDCGANIGVTMLEWKYRWPGAEVVCIEPDPYAFELLQRTVERNDIPSVRCINAAVNDVAGTATLFGEIAPTGDARGNSIDPGWGRRPQSDSLTVTCQTLSSVIRGRQVDFLKLDVEGVEERVIAEIVDDLPRIDAIYVEVHQTAVTAAYNSPQRIEDLLRRSGFCVETESRAAENSLPATQRGWQRRVGSRQSQLIGWRESAD